MTLMEMAAPEQTLDELAATANDEHRHITRQERSTLERAIRAGNVLLEARRRCPRGSWTEWAREHLNFDVSTANDYMRFATHKDALQDCRSLNEAARRLQELGLRRPNPCLPGPPPKRSEDELRVLRERHASGVPQRVLAAELGVSQTHVSRLLYPERNRRRVRAYRARKRAEAAAAKKALAREQLAKSIKRIGGSFAHANEYVRKAADAFGRVAEETEDAEVRVLANEALLKLYAVEDVVKNGLGVEGVIR